MSDPLRILELRSVRGTGGGPEKTILLGAAQSDPSRYQVTVAYLRAEHDPLFTIDGRARALGLDYVDVFERGAVDRRAWAQLRALVADRRIDIVHGHDYKTNLLALLLGRATGVIPLTTAHGWTGHSAAERFVYYPADKLIARFFPRVIAVSSEIRDTLVRWGCPRARVRVVLNGIDHRAFVRDRQREQEARGHFGVGAGDFVIGAVGRLEPQKRFDLLLEAFARIASERADVRLLIAGEGSLRPALEAQIAQLGLGDRCRLLGHCADIPLFHHALDLFVQSSVYEGTPNVVLEAMALETPVVATTAGGTAELVRDGIDGLLVPPGSVEALVAALNRAIGDPGATAGRCQSARRRVETDLSFEARMRTVERIYDELAGRLDRSTVPATVDPGERDEPPASDGRRGRGIATR